MLKKKNNKELNYEQLGKMLESIYESGYIDHAKAYRMSFIKGVIGGLGGVIGATLVVGLFAWMLSLFHHVPFVNHISDNLRSTVEHSDTRQ